MLSLNGLMSHFCAYLICDEGTLFIVWVDGLLYLLDLFSCLARVFHYYCIVKGEVILVFVGSLVFLPK